MTLNRFVLAAALVLVVGGISASARADDSAKPVASSSVELERLERAHRAKQTNDRERTEQVISGALRGLFGLALLVIVPTGMSIYTWSKRRTRRVTVPMKLARRLQRRCLVTGSKEDLDRDEVRYQYTSKLATAVGLLSLISLFTGGLLYRPGKRWIDLPIGLSDEGRRLAAEGQRLLMLSHGSRALLWAGFLAAAVLVKIALLWVVPLVLALTVPALLAEKAAACSTPRCLSLTDDAIDLEFGQQEVADAVRRSIARA